MVNEREATAEIKRLAQLEHYPANAPEARAELIAVAQQASTIARLRKVIDGCVRGGVGCPRPAELLSALNEPAPYVSRGEPRCPLCYGTGWATVFALVTRQFNRTTCKRLTEAQYYDLTDKIDGKTQELVTAVEACHCAGVRSEAA